MLEPKVLVLENHLEKGSSEFVSELSKSAIQQMQPCETVIRTDMTEGSRTQGKERKVKFHPCSPHS